MKTLILAATALSLSGCATVPNINTCKTAELRRTTYTTAIRAADIYAMSGKPVPQAVVIGREAAVTALAILNLTCPSSPLDPQ